MIKEIKGYLNSDNIENASKRLLDLVWYDYRDSSAYDEVIHLRKEYNLSKSLGQKELGEDDILNYKERINFILKELENKASSIQVGEEGRLVSVKKLSKSFNHRSKKFVFGEVSIEINKGDIVGVVGENGNGKTTFLRLVLEEISKDGGELDYYYKIQDLASSEEYKRKNRTAFIPQRVSKWQGTLIENIVYTAAIHGFKGKANTKIVEYVIHRMGLSAFTGLKWSELSTGYKLRFELAKMLVWEPDILILDEPLANLDIQATQNLLEDLRFFANSNHHPVGILFTSQQLHEVEQISDKILFLRNGQPVFCGNKSDFADSREQRIIEISLKEHSDAIHKVLKGKIQKISVTDKIIRLHFSMEYSCNDIISIIINSGIELTYFRDITNSTVQLFNN